MQQIQGQTHDGVADNLSQLQQLFPEVFSEGKVQWEKLQQLMGEDAMADKESYNFTWKGKKDAIKLALARTTGTLRPEKDKSKNWDETENLFIEGDNLEVLRVLQESYRGKIKMIYIDPPYNTGKDFVYKDNFVDNVASYKESSGENLKANPDTSGRYHTNWLNMMYPRLKLAKSLLTEDGVIFMSIDDNEESNLKFLCEEIFGSNNFISKFIWSGKSGSEDDGNIRNNHEYCISYSRSASFDVGLDIKDEEKYPYYDDKNKDHYKTQLLRKRGDNSKRSDRPNLYYSIPVNGKDDFFPTLPDGSDGCWRRGKEKMNLAIRNNFIEFKTNRDGKLEAYEKIFKNDLSRKTKKFQSLLLDAGSTSGGTKEVKSLFVEKVFDRPKDTKYISTLLNIANTGGNDIILDFFAGSSTTAHAVMKLNAEDNGNRKFIMVQIPEIIDEKSEAYKAGYKTISEISSERIRRAGEKIKEEHPDADVDIGFKYFSLDSTNLKKRDENPEDISQSLLDYADPLIAERSQDDLLYEVMLKLGYKLSDPVQESEILGKKVYNVAHGHMIVCMEKGLSADFISALRNSISSEATEPTIVLYDEGFADDVAKLNAIKQLEEAGTRVMVL